MGANSLALLRSAEVHRELGFSSPLSPSNTVTIEQVVPIVHLSDGYLGALVQETFISAFLARTSIDWLMGVVDSFREAPPRGPAVTSSPVPVKGKGKRTGGKHSPKGCPKGKGRATGGRSRGRGARGRGARSPSLAAPCPFAAVPGIHSVTAVAGAPAPLLTTDSEGPTETP